MVGQDQLRHPRDQGSRDRLSAFDAFAEIAVHIHEGRAKLTEVLDLIAQSATTLLGTDTAWLALVDQADGKLRPVVLVGFGSSRFLEVSLPMGRGVIGRALATRRTVVVEDYVTYDHPTSAAVRSVIEEEGIRSLICCPLFRSEQSIGALYVGRRSPSSFAPDDVGLLEALAGQASVAIENHRLYARLREQNTALERSLLVHDQFTSAVLDGVGLEGIAGILTDLIGCPVRVQAPALGLAPVTSPPTFHPGDAHPRTSERIEASGRTLGTLEVFHDNDLSSLDINALEHARTVCALELVKLGYAAEVERRSKSRLLDELLEPDADLTALQPRAARWHIDLHEPFRILVIRLRAPEDNPNSVDDAVHTALRAWFGSARSRVLLTKRAGAVVAAVPADLAATASPLAARMSTELVGAARCGAIGVGPQSSDIPAGFRAADACATLGIRSAHGGKARVVAYDDLGLLNFLLDAPSIEHTRAAVARVLEPLRRHDDTNRLQLLPTVREYLAADGHQARTCERLFIGATTLKYRLARISELLGTDLREPSTRFQLRMAVELHDFVEAVDGSPA